MSNLHNLSPSGSHAPPLLLTAQQMGWLEQRAIDAGRISQADLMARAGHHVARHAERLGDGRIKILCGPGNNGGDGYAAARLLHDAGRAVSLHHLPSRCAGAAAAMRERWLQVGEAAPLATFTPLAGDIVIDALFGTGLTRPIDAVCAKALADASRTARLVAVDILSGIDATTGEILAASPFADARAEVTVALETAKCGHYLGEGGARSGSVIAVPLGLEADGSDLARDRGVARLFRPDIAACQQRFAKTPLGYKHVHGHALVFGGPPGAGGAARLAARASLRVGCGLVTLAVSPDARPENAARLDAVMLTMCDPYNETPLPMGSTEPDAICIGPGYGVGTATRRRILSLLSMRRPIVLDADALSSFADRPDDLFADLHDRALLTPHLGEFRRLFPDLVAPHMSRIDAACQAAIRCGATVLIKGPDSVIAAPNEPPVIVAGFDVPHAAWLATAGSGDVLAGLATGLMARGADCATAACWAGWVLLRVAQRCGPGLIAEDLPDALPTVLADIFEAKL